MSVDEADLALWETAQDLATRLAYVSILKSSYVVVFANFLYRTATPQA